MTHAIQSAARAPHAPAAPRFRETNAVCIEAQPVNKEGKKPVQSHTFQYHMAGMQLAAQAASVARTIPAQAYAPQAFAAKTGARVNISI